MTPQQLTEDLERRNLAAQQAFQALNAVSPGAGALAAETIANARAQQALGATGVVAPGAGAGLVSQAAFPTAQAPVSAPAVEKPAEKAAEAVPVTQGSSYFYDMLMQNDAMRQKGKEDYERREKADSARLRIAAVTDALASLGNLVGTTQGAFSQPQTYQVPFVYEDMEKNREKARQYADYLNRNDQSIRLQQMKDELSERSLDRQLAVQKEITERAMMNNASKLGIATQNNESKEKIAKMQDDTKRYTVDENNKTKKDVAEANNASRETVAAIRHSGGGGGGSRSGGRNLTPNARMKYIVDNASFAVNGELANELKARGVKLPFDWQKDWRRYVSQAPEFYKKYFAANGWEQLGGNINNVGTKTYNYVESEQPEEKEKTELYNPNQSGKKADPMGSG